MNEYWRVRLRSGEKVIGTSDCSSEEEARRLMKGLDGFSFTIVAELEHWTKISSERVEVIGKHK